MAIRDINDDEIYSVSFSLRSGSVSVATIQIDCVDGYSLYGEAVGDVAVEAKHDAGAYVNIETTPLDLSPWDGLLETFQVRLTAGTITALTRRAFILTVRRTT